MSGEVTNFFLHRERRIKLQYINAEIILSKLVQD